jgi:hypothetical protein
MRFEKLRFFKVKFDQCSRLIGDQLLFAVQVKFEVSGNFMLQVNSRSAALSCPGEV